MNTNGTYQHDPLQLPIACEALLHEDAIYLYLDDPAKSFRIWRFAAFHSIQLNGSTLIVKHGNPPNETFECTGPTARLIYDAWSKAKNNPAPPAKNRMPGFMSAGILIFFLGLIGLCLAAYFLILPWAGEKATALVPVEAEIQMGEQLSKAYTGQEQINDSATYFANRFIQQLKLDSVYPLRVRVAESPEINAFALPGGNIVVYSGILKKMNSYEELAALLGHEATHVIGRHSLKSVFRSAASSLLIASVFGDLSGLSSVMLSQADRFKQLDYSRELETEADDKGLELMVKNKVSPRGMLQLLELLKAEGAETPALMKYLSTHPDTEARIKNMASQKESYLIFPENTALKTDFNHLKRQLKN